MSTYKNSLLLFLILLSSFSLKSQQNQFIYQSGESLIGNDRHKLELINLNEAILFLDNHTMHQFNPNGDLLRTIEIPEISQHSTVFYFERTSENETIASISEGEVEIMKIEGSILNPDFNIVWKEEYEIHNISHFFSGPGLIKDNNGDYLLIDRNYIQLINGDTGELNTKNRNAFQQPADIITKGDRFFLPSSIGDVFIGVTNKNGNPLWKIDFEDLGNFSGIASLQEGFIASGNLNNNGFLSRHDDFGELIWVEFFPNTKINEVVPTKDNGFAAIGSKDNNVHLIKTDSLGKLAWEKSYKEGIGWKLTQTIDEGFAIGARHKDSFSYFLKTDTQGIVNNQIQQTGTNVAILSPNNTRSVFNASGLQFWDDENQLIGDNEGHFELSPESMTSTIFAGGLWLGGTTNGEIRVAAQSYNSDPLASDFKAGQVDEETDFFNQIWKITKVEINDFLGDLSDGSIDNAIPFNILKYPAKGNPNASNPAGIGYSINQDLAPFVDANEDGMYNPQDGDYPMMKGDQMLYWVVSDNEQHNYSGGLPVGVEIYYTAYGFNQPDKSILHNTIFVEAEIVNKSTNDYTDFHVGQWLDPKIGCSDETLVGSYPKGHFFFAYNRDADNGGESCDFFEITPFGTNIPIQTTMLLNQEMSAFTYYQRDDIAAINGMGAPLDDNQHYNLLTGKWRDGTPLALKDNGYYPFADTTNFAFSGNPANPDEWSLCSVDSFSLAARVVGSTGPNLLPAGERIKFDLAFTNFENIPHPCPNILPIASELEVLRCFYNAGNPEDIFKVNLGKDTLVGSPNGFILDAGIEGVSYKWSTLENTQQITLSESGIYRVTVTAENGCNVKDEIFVNSLLENFTNETLSLQEVDIWPNPSTQKVTLSLDEINISGMVDLQLINAQGQVVLQNSILLKKGTKHREHIDVSKLIPGTYYVHLTKGSNTYIKRKILVVR